MLNKSRFFHVVGGMPPDAMHDILEGVLYYNVKETLKALIFEKGLFSINELNKRIASFDCGYHNGLSKPTPLQRSRLTSSDHSIKQYGTVNTWFILHVQMLLLLIEHFLLLFS